MNEKVKLPKAVCDALDWAKSYDVPNELILKRVLNGYAIENELKPLLQRDFDIIMRALVLGYELEMTPEEQIKEKYNYYNKNKTQYTYGYHKGVQDALRIHGIEYDWLEDDTE